MGQVSITIRGRQYQIACDDGQEAHVARLGRYLDQLEKRSGEWRMLVRKCTIEMTADTDATWVYSQNIKGFLKARWDGKDPSYERPFAPNNEGLRW